jgi:anti-sigma-K factor RskA
MSGSLPPEDRAGLYVLGALDAEEMREVRIAAGRDDRLAAEIAAWERRLTPLTALVDPVEPPATLWSQVEARIARGGAAAETLADIVQLPKQRPPTPRRSAPERAMAAWRGAALGAMALAAGLAVTLVLQKPAPLPPPGQVAMLLPLRDGEGGWLLQVKPNGEIRAEAQRALTRTAAQDFELWALPAGGTKPVPLGLLPVNGAAVLKPAELPAQKFQFLVSLEPRGGSPTGLPTGPIQFGGEPVEQ